MQHPWTLSVRTQGGVVVPIPDEARDERVRPVVARPAQREPGGQVVQEGHVRAGAQRGAKVAQQHRKRLAQVGRDAVALRAPALSMPVPGESCMGLQRSRKPELRSRVAHVLHRLGVEL